MKWLMALVVIGLAACGSPTVSPPPMHTVHITMTLTDTSGNGITTMGTSCDGSGGYSDISQGSSVTLMDGKNNIIGTTTLQDGTTTDSGVTCDFTAEIPKVTEVPFYSLTVGHRSAISYSLSELKGDNWSVPLTMGS